MDGGIDLEPTTVNNSPQSIMHPSSPLNWINRQIGGSVLSTNLIWPLECRFPSSPSLHPILRFLPRRLLREKDSSSRYLNFLSIQAIDPPRLLGEEKSCREKGGGEAIFQNQREEGRRQRSRSWTKKKGKEMKRA